jgi:hypothetical protein
MRRNEAAQFADYDFTSCATHRYLSYHILYLFYELIVKDGRWCKHFCLPMLEFKSSKTQNCRHRLVKCWGNYCQIFQIRHYCNTSTMLTMAVPSQVNPILAVNLPLVLATPPPLPGLSILNPTAGGSPATEALRLSLLGVGAIHQAYLLARSAGTDMSLAKATHGGAADELMNLAISYRLQATKCLALACQTIEGTRSDAALGASVTIALIDVSLLAHCL